MTPEQFVFWLHGVLSVSTDDSELDKKIRRVLEKVVGRTVLKNLRSINVLSNAGTTPPSANVDNES